MTAALATRASLAEIEAYRNRALDQYGQAHDMIMAANEMLRAAGETLRKAAPAADGMMMTQDQRKSVFGSYEVGKREEFLAIARQMVDADCWTSVVKTVDLERLMDKKAKDELRAQLRTSPPPFTEETAASTLEKFAGEAGMIFRRGIAEVFSSLDRRFRTHTGWKIGSRVILSSAFDEWGHWNYHRNHRDTLQDIERTFLILDGRKAVAQYAGIVGEIDAARRAEGRCLSARQTEVEGEFFKVRIFQNGNAHLWFKRDDLVAIANRMIGEYYGEVIPEERKHDNDDGGLHEPKRSLAKNFGFFPTPDALADRAIEDAKLYRPDHRPLRVLEPSAGTGQLARRARQKGASVVCVEYQRDLAAKLMAEGFGTYPGDFLDVTTDTIGTFDRVIMNPPFDRERDIDHVMHALKFLKPDGFLIAIMSAHTEFAETRKAKAFRDLMVKMNARWSDNPRGSFSSVGTNVNTITLRVFADGRSFY